MSCPILTINLTSDLSLGSRSAAVSTQRTPENTALTASSGNSFVSIPDKASSELDPVSMYSVTPAHVQLSCSSRTNKCTNHVTPDINSHLTIFLKLAPFRVFETCTIFFSSCGTFMPKNGVLSAAPPTPLCAITCTADILCAFTHPFLRACANVFVARYILAVTSVYIFYGCTNTTARARGYLYYAETNYSLLLGLDSSLHILYSAAAV